VTVLLMSSEGAYLRPSEPWQACSSRFKKRPVCSGADAYHRRGEFDLAPDMLMTIMPNMILASQIEDLSANTNG